MLKIKQIFEECKTCDYRYVKGDVNGCVFPNHAPIDSMARCECNKGEDSGIEIDEECVLIKNIVNPVIL